MPHAPRNLTLTAVPGVRVGQAENAEFRSGVTAILFDRASPTVVDVRGGATCTYDTASLSLASTFGRRWALFFSGGSLFGLDAARGIRTRILETGGGHTLFRNPTPIAPISGAALFDLPERPAALPDYLPLGYEAARTASRDPIPDGQRGAGAGATVGKYLGRSQSMPGGMGSAATRVPGGHMVGVLVVVNAVGAVRDPSDGTWIAGARGKRGKIVPPSAAFPRASSPFSLARGSTLMAVVTDRGLTRSALQRLAIMAHSGLARTVSPVHTSGDGDVLFATTTTEPRELRRKLPELYAADVLGQSAAELVIHAVRRAVTPRRTSLRQAGRLGATRSRAVPVSGRSS